MFSALFFQTMRFQKSEIRQSGVFHNYIKWLDIFQTIYSATGSFPLTVNTILYRGCHQSFSFFIENPNNVFWSCFLLPNLPIFHACSIESLSLYLENRPIKIKQPTTTTNNNDDDEKVQSTDTHKHRGAHKTHKNTNWKIIILKQKTSMI